MWRTDDAYANPCLTGTEIVNRVNRSSVPVDDVVKVFVLLGYCAWEGIEKGVIDEYSRGHSSTASTGCTAANRTARWSS
jgi:hypothetical protein